MAKYGQKIVSFFCRPVASTISRRIPITGR